MILKLYFKIVFLSKKEKKNTFNSFASQQQHSACTDENTLIFIFIILL